MAEIAEQTIELTVGGEVRVALPGRGSGGFVWSVAPPTDTGVVAIARSAGERPPLPPAGGPPPNSYSLDEILIITGLKPGTVVLDARLGRPGGASIAERRFRVHVTE